MDSLTCSRCGRPCAGDPGLTEHLWFEGETPRREIVCAQCLTPEELRLLVEGPGGGREVLPLEDESGDT